jgi:2',3'-cyclic-nucleotide 2'-phosphodiesterase (5'-nucleotidase family)
MDGMVLLGTDAAGAGEKELKYGYAFLKANIERSGLPVVCSNLFLKKTGKPALTPYLIKKVGNVKVGIFSLMSDKVAYGPSQDSLRVEEPAAAAKRVVAEMRKKGATITVLLSQLGKVDSEDLVAAVPGIDCLIVGHASSLLMKGRMIKNTVACYGG